MKRDEFINTLTIGASAFCMGCLLACRKEDGQQTELQDKDILLKIDFSSNLLDVGQFKTENGILVVRVGATNEVYAFRAVEAACSLSGDSIQYNRQTTRFSCANHGSIFDMEGRLLSGPAKLNLKKYNLRVSGNDVLVYAPGTIEPLPEPVNFNIDLDTELKNIGDYKHVKNVIVLRTALANLPESFVALSSVCTHQGSTIDYKPAQNQFVCPTHGSTYSTSGEVVRGPAPNALKKYKATVTVNILNISEE